MTEHRANKKKSPAANTAEVVAEADSDFEIAARDLIVEVDKMIGAKLHVPEQVRLAAERVRALLPPIPPPPAPPAPMSKRLPFATWDEAVLAWALSVNHPITTDRAITAFGSEDPAAVMAALTKLPPDRFVLSWTMGTAGALTRKWTRV